MNRERNIPELCVNGKIESQRSDMWSDIVDYVDIYIP